MRECAERGAPADTVDLWPAIKGRVSAQGTGRTRAGGAQASAARVGDDPRRRALLVPDHPLGWVLTALSVLIVGVGVYAASGLVRDLPRSGLPGPGADGIGETTDVETTGLGQADGPVGGKVVAERMFRSEVPGVGDERLRQTESVAGARVTLVRAYADAGSVVVGFTFEDLKGGGLLGGHPAKLLPGYDMGSFGVRLTDESGTEFRFVSGGGQESSGPKPIGQMVVFEPVGEIEPDAKHRFRLEIPIVEVPDAPPGVDTDEFRRVGETLVIGFEAPVWPAPVVEVNRKATAASGITLTLERVTDSPGQPKAVICLESRDGVRSWLPIGEDMAFQVSRPVKGEGDCLLTPLRHPLDGRSSVTVSDIEINPLEGEVIRGPWRFEFEVPES